MIDAEDQQLIHQVQEGNEHAFEALVNKYQKHIYFASYRMTHNHADADDILQETFIKFFEAIRDQKKIDHLPGWLYRVAVNLSIDKMRYEKRRPAKSIEAMQEESDNENISFIDTKTPSAREELITLERRRLIRKAMDSLPVQQRTITILHDLQGLTVKEIAIILVKSEGTIKSTLFTAHRKLREKLNPILIQALGESAAPIPPPKKDTRFKQKIQDESRGHINTKRGG